MWTLKQLVLLQIFVLAVHTALLPSIPLPSITASNIIKQTINVGQAAISQVINKAPSTTETLRLPIHVLSGLPSKVLIGALSELCSIVSKSDNIKPKEPPKLEKLNLVFYTPTENVSYPLNAPEKLLDHPHFKHDNKLCIFVTGWLTDIGEKNPAIETIYKPYMSRDDINLVILDSGKYIDTLYSWSSFQTQPIGEYLGAAIAKLSKRLPLKNFHVIGHSLGSHISGAAGKMFKKLTGKLLPHITGLDPAKPCFKEGEVLTGLQRGNAEFIDIIHTNSGVLGKEEPIGDVDFYPNGDKPIQPGCVTPICAHYRAVDFYAQTVYKAWENAFLSVQCSSLTAIKNQRCTGDPIPMGMKVPHTAKGLYYLQTTSRAPFN